MLLEEITWWGYGYIAKKVENDKQWKRTLNNKLNKKVSIQGMRPIDFWSKVNPSWDCIKTFAIDRETQKIIPTSAVYNSNTTRRKVQTIIALNLFS